MGGNTSLSSVGRAPDCSCVKTNVSADIRVSPVQVWERGPTTSVQLQCWSPRTREVERFQTLPLSWERGLFLQPHGTSPLNREVGRFLLHPLSWERGPMPCYWREMLSCVRWCGAGRGTAPPKSRFIPSRLDARGPCKQSIHAFHNQNILMIRNCPNARVSLSTSILSNGHFGLKVYSGRFILPCSLSISLSN